ncbi:MAG: hypothetical protein JXA23_09980 [Bacteroidales bacterium]|nr:hypothetical protein [Bacteroidales bacterium]
MKFLKNHLLLVSLITIILSSPFLEDYRSGGLISLFLLSVSTFLCLLILSVHRRIFWAMVIISILTIGTEVFHLFFPSSILSTVQYFNLSVLIFLFAGILFYTIMTLKSLSFSDLSNAISIYLLLGIGFGFLYSFIEKIHPGSISSATPGNYEISGDMIYYSFSVLTTVGFGDMTPLGKVAKVLAMSEAVLGVLYIAIMIGRLVGISTSEKHKNN